MQKTSQRDDDEGPRGFARNLKPNKILAADERDGELFFFMMWEDCDKVSWASVSITFTFLLFSAHSCESEIINFLWNAFYVLNLA